MGTRVVLLVRANYEPGDNETGSRWDYDIGKWMFGTTDLVHHISEITKIDWGTRGGYVFESLMGHKYY
jgi:hypothetical protein